MALPEELRQTPQWLVSGPDKIPVSPVTGSHADVRDRSLYVSYDVAVAYAQQRGFDVGFALTTEDPYVCIDLDAPSHEQQVARHQAIFERFDSYSELSRSETGVHIWCRGQLPRGVRRDCVEVYPHSRYIICTGKTILDRPVRYQQELLEQLFFEISRGAVGAVGPLVERGEVLDDEAVYTMGAGAANADKFNDLWDGNWQQLYPSQSEADYALMDMLAYYTRSNQQAKRLFRYSALGQRDKALREDYLDRMLQKIRAEEAPEIDFSHIDPTVSINGGTSTSGMVQNGYPQWQPGYPQIVDVPGIGPVETGYFERVKIKSLPLTDPRKIAAPPLRSTPSPTSVPDRKNLPQGPYPPGFLGEIAEYIVASAYLPVREVGVAAALGLCAGVLGRQFNVGTSGLNQYIILLGKTGIGKDGASQGIERILTAARQYAPVVDTFVGPGNFGSGQGLVRWLDQQPCFMTLLGECGLWLQELSDPRTTNPVTRNMRRMLLDLYGKSGRNGVLNPTAYSDQQKNTKKLFAPAMTLLGESTPEQFYAGLSLQHVADGLIPRFLIIEYKGDRPRQNENPFFAPSDALIRRFCTLVETALRMQQSATFADVTVGPDAQVLLDEFAEQCNAHMSGGGTEGIRQIWNRAHLKALRLAALLAATDRPHECQVNAAEASWAIQGVYEDCVALEARFESGDVGEGTSKQNNDLLRVLNDYLNDPEIARKYDIPQEYPDNRVVPHVYLARRTANLSAFKNHRNGGARGALKEALGELMAAGVLQRVPAAQARSKFNTSADLYFLTNLVKGV